MTTPDREQRRQEAVDAFNARMSTMRPPAPPRPVKRPKPPPTKRRITVEERQLIAVADMAARLARDWPSYTAVEAAIGPPTVAAGSTEPGRSSTSSNPTATVALAHGRYDDLCEAVNAWHAQGVWLERQVRHVLAEAGATVAAIRCSQPTCVRDAVRKGLCWGHYRQELEQPGEAS